MILTKIITLEFSVLTSVGASPKLSLIGVILHCLEISTTRMRMSEDRNFRVTGLRILQKSEKL